MTNSCETCWFARTIDGNLSCVRNPPDLVLGTMKQTPPSMWPIIKAYWSCGEYSADDPDVFGKGYVGPPGENGKDGKDGIDGVGIPGPPGQDGKDGESVVGPKGDPGQSITGPAGPRGNTISSGSGNPAIQAISGDLYIDSVTGNLWSYT